MRDHEKLLEKINREGTGLDEIAVYEMQADRDGFIEFLLHNFSRIDETRLEGLLEGLASTGDKSALEALAGAVDDLSEKRTAMILKLWASDPDDRYLPYIEKLAASKNSRVRANVVETIEQFPGGLSLDLLRKMLLDEDNRVRANAALALWKQGLTEGFDLLKRMLRSPDIWTRASASFAISSIGDPEFLELLEKACEDESPSVREKAIEALSNIGDKRAVPALKKLAIESQEHDFIAGAAIAVLWKLTDGEIDSDIRKAAEKRGIHLPGSTTEVEGAN